MVSRHHRGHGQPTSWHFHGQSQLPGLQLVADCIFMICASFQQSQGRNNSWFSRNVAIIQPSFIGMIRKMESSWSEDNQRSQKHRLPTTKYWLLTFKAKELQGYGFIPPSREVVRRVVREHLAKSTTPSEAMNHHEPLSSTIKKKAFSFATLAFMQGLGYQVTNHSDHDRCSASNPWVEIAAPTNGPEPNHHGKCQHCTNGSC